jgi:hypothetical protein
MINSRVLISIVNCLLWILCYIISFLLLLCMSFCVDSLSRDPPGGKFDVPDRVFCSINQIWQSCSKTSHADVKELIPEVWIAEESRSVANWRSASSFCIERVRNSIWDFNGIRSSLINLFSVLFLCLSRCSSHVVVFLQPALSAEHEPLRHGRPVRWLSRRGCDPATLGMNWSEKKVRWRNWTRAPWMSLGFSFSSLSVYLAHGATCSLVRRITMHASMWWRWCRHWRAHTSQETYITGPLVFDL